MEKLTKKLFDGIDVQEIYQKFKVDKKKDAKLRKDNKKSTIKKILTVEQVNKINTEIEESVRPFRRIIPANKEPNK